MRYSQIRSMDISNGLKLGISLFVQGCPFKCKNCFNQDTWNFEEGKEWNNDIKEKFINLANRPQIKRISILGGEPLASQNINSVLDLVNDIHKIYGDSKKIWLYTGFTFEEIYDCSKEDYQFNQDNHIRQQIINNCDVLVDGRFIDNQKDFRLRFRGSKNQRLINVKETLLSNQLTLLNV